MRVIKVMIVGTACQSIAINLPIAGQTLTPLNILILLAATAPVQRHHTLAQKYLRVEVVLIRCETGGIDLRGAAGTGLYACDFGFRVVVEVAVEGISDD